MQSPQFKPRTKGPALFRHQSHETAGVDCIVNHDYVRSRNVWRKGLPVEKCEECHPVQSRAEALDLKNAFHRQCKGCHLKLRQRSRVAGPIKCQDFHRSG